MWPTSHRWSLSGVAAQPFQIAPSLFGVNGRYLGQLPAADRQQPDRRYQSDV